MSEGIDRLDDPIVKLNHALNMKITPIVKFLCKFFILTVTNDALRTITLDQIIKTRVNCKVPGHFFLDIKNCIWNLGDTNILVPFELAEYYKEIWGNIFRKWLLSKGNEPLPNVEYLVNMFQEQTGIIMHELQNYLGIN